MPLNRLVASKPRFYPAGRPVLFLGLAIGTASAATAQVATPASPVADAPAAQLLHATQRHQRNVAYRRSLQTPPRFPESASQGQVSNANKNAPTAGVFPFVPPSFTKLDGAGLWVDTRGIYFATDDGGTQFRVGGRYQEDFSAAALTPHLRTPALAENLDSRRAWAEFYLTLSNGISAAFQYDFANVTMPISDAVVGYHPPGVPVVASIGNFKEPFSLNQLISDNNSTFTERSLMDGLVPGRNFGGSVATYGEVWTAEAAAYGGNANIDPGGNGIAGTARVTYAPILRPDQVLHFGAAGSYRSLDPNGLIPSFSSRPEDNLEIALISTGSLRNADAIERANAEFLYQYKSWRIQGEYTYANVTGRNGQADRPFQGGYVESAWVINGAGRPYRLVAPYGSEFAILQGVQVEDPQRISNGGIGVFEVAARYSALDLQAPNVKGGSEQDVTAGLNWYPDRNIRMMADYVHSWADPAAFSVGRGRAVEGDAFVGRMQVYW